LTLAAAGVVVAAVAAAAAILLAPGRLRAVAMLIALALFPLLIAGDQWHSPQIAELRDEPLQLIALVAAALIAVLALAAVFHRWPLLLPLAIVAALPFRIPLESGGDTANLLVPLYAVIAGGVLSAALGEWQQGGGVHLNAGFFAGRRTSLAEESGRKTGRRIQIDPPSLLPCVLAGIVLLYAAQTLYSPDFSKSLQNVCFFFVPFSLVYAVLRDVSWDRKLLKCVLVVIAVEAVAFVLVGSVEYVVRELFWNDQVIRSNEFHTYFRVNSIFWDPNIYGRYLALVIVIAMAVLLWIGEQRTLALLTGLVVVLWLGLVLTFSQSSFAALLTGLAVLAALRWSLRWTLAAVAAGAVLAVAIVIFAGGISKLSPDRLNVDTGGRTNLISGGTDLFAKRPIWGYGAGSFPRAYREQVATKKAPVAVSHTEPITVAAEQGLVGLAAYAAFIGVALWTMSSGLGSMGGGGGVPPGQRRPVFRKDRSARDDPSKAKNPATGRDTPAPCPTTIARAAVLAAFAALLVHTFAYAAFYEDPITWVLLAAGASLAGAGSTAFAFSRAVADKQRTRD
jgi:O-antigen ligase